MLLLQGDGSLVVAGHLDAVLPLENGETGLLAVEVHPEFESTRLLYFYHSVANTKGGTPKNRDRLVSMVLRPDDTLDLASEAVLLDGLESPAGIHHGGGLSIGPDRCLCKILRIALDGSIPPDNPLVGVGNVPACGDTCESMPSTVGAPREAIWAWGFRNPFRLWVDPKTGIPWVADVGERAFEEIDLARRGGHYGWPWREGRHGYPIGRCAEITGEPCEDPVYECAHGGAGPDASCVAITGGAILDECSWPAAYRRRYWFSDSGSATLSALEVPPARDGVVGGSRIDVAVIEGWPIAVRPGPDGNLYVLSHFGRLVRVRPRVRQACEPITLTIAGPPSLPTPPTPPEMHEETVDIHADDLPWVTARGAGCRRRRGHETCSRGAQ